MSPVLARSCRRWAALSALLGTAVALVPAPARACSWGQVLIEASYPRGDAEAVPTNAVLFVYGSSLLAPEELQLLDESGQRLAFEVHAAVPSGFDLAPLEELQPNQTYQLLPSDPSLGPLLEFTTGSGPAAVPESLSAPELEVVHLSYAVGSCGVLGGLCVESSLAANTTLEVRVGNEVLERGADPAWPLHRAYSQPLSDSDCVEVRARDVRGHRSAPRTVCGDAIARFELQGDNFETPYTCDNYLDYVRAPGPEPEGVAPEEVSSPVVGGNSPVSENASTPRDVSYVADSVDLSPATGSDTVIYDDVPSVRSSRGCALVSSAPRGAAGSWLGWAALALLGARRRR
jgi:hypothetical protein